MDDRKQWEELGQQLRVDSVRASAAANSGHPTSAMSAADLIAVLASQYLLYDFDAPADPSNDHLIFSKGHASPLLYALYKAVGAIDDAELLRYRQLDSRLQGHPTPVIPWVDVATGSLGQGLPTAVGIAMAGKYLDKLGYRVWVLCGDGELAEGSMWEAFEQASCSKLSNLTAILDINRLGQSGETRHGWDTASYARRLRAVGWNAVEIDGHDVSAINAAYAEAIAVVDRPTAIVARTIKGRGVKSVANKNGYHGKPLPDPDAAIAELGGVRDARIYVHRPRGGSPRLTAPAAPVTLAGHPRGARVSTRQAFGESVAALGAANERVVLLDGDVQNSTCAEAFARQIPDRFFEMFIAEQQLVAAAIGMQARGYLPFVSTFGAFFTRAHDFIRMAAISRANVRFVGSHAGVSIGSDGPSQMALEDIAMFRAVHGSTVLYSSDANQTMALVHEMVAREGVVYLRTTRGALPVLYAPGESFPIGGSKLPRATKNDAIAIVAAGITVHESLLAADALAHEGIAARVLDCYSIKPIDAASLRAAARMSGGRLIVVEDHHPEGGLGDAVLEVFARDEQRPRVFKLAVYNLPGSASPREQLERAQIDATAIVQAARELVLGPRAVKGKAA